MQLRQSINFSVRYADIPLRREFLIRANRSMVNQLPFDEAWGTATRCAALARPMPSFFSAAIRAIRSAESILKVNDREKIREFSLQAIRFPIKVSPTLIATYYFAADQLYPEELQKLGTKPSLTKLLSLMTPDELTSILTLTYFFRTLRKCTPEYEWNRLLPRMLIDIEIGGLLGSFHPHVGRGHGMLLGAIRYFGLCVLSRADAKAFKEYRRRLESRNYGFSTPEEETTWGCNHLQIGARLLTESGFGLVPSLSFGISVNPISIQPTAPSILAAATEAQAWQGVLSAIEVLRRTGTLPEAIRKSEHAAVRAAAQQIIRESGAIIAAAPPVTWVNRPRADLADETARSLEMPWLGDKQTERSEEDSGQTAVAGP